MAKSYWLMKSEPDAYSIDKFKKEKSTLWDGIRNYQARNFMMKDMKKGDEFIFYHSNAKPPGAIGIGKVIELAQPDPSQFNKKSQYYDPKSSKDKPRWHCVKVGFVSKFKRLVSLAEIKENPELQSMMLIKKGVRLSIQPVTSEEFKKLKSLGQQEE